MNNPLRTLSVKTHPRTISAVSPVNPVQDSSIKTPEVVEVDQVSYSYAVSRRGAGTTKALNDISFQIGESEIFAVLGPNGSGKSTLFRILSTLLQPTSGQISIFRHDLRRERDKIRQLIGVVFQHPSLDKKLTAAENLRHQGHLYQLRGQALRERINDMLGRLGMLERSGDLVERLSGGMQRRVELAKALLHKPRLLILDEPSTGLDPGARRDFADYLHELREKDGTTVLLTTHILDEAEQCDRLAIFDEGRLVTLGTPQDLRQEIGGDVITMTSDDTKALSELIRKQFGGTPQVVGETVRVEREHGHEFIPMLVQSFPRLINSVTLSKPTLEDVFIHKTGRSFWREKGVME